MQYLIRFRQLFFPPTCPRAPRQTNSKFLHEPLCTDQGGAQPNPEVGANKLMRLACSNDLEAEKKGELMASTAADRLGVETSSTIDLSASRSEA